MKKSADQGGSLYYIFKLVKLPLTRTTAVVGFLMFLTFRGKTQKLICFVNFLVFSLPLSVNNWVFIFSSLKLENLVAAISPFVFLHTHQN